jgi:predicted DNA-binding antitoxin AbrB/MazE fold protein
MTTINAIFRNGTFQPIGKVELPEECHVRLQVEPVEGALAPPAAIAGIYRIMDMRFRSGEHDVAERHNEHQP